MVQSNVRFRPIADIRHVRKKARMEQSSEDADKNPGCFWGCLAVFLVGVALFALGFRVVGQAAVLATFVMALVAALRTGQLEWSFTRRTVNRQQHPLAFWCIVALLAVLACGALWFFVKALRETWG